MKFSIDKSTFTEGIQRVIHAISTRSTDSVLENIYLRTLDNEGKLELTAADGQIMIVSLIDCGIEEKGECLVNGKLLNSAVKKFYDGTIHFNLNENNYRISMKMGKTNITLSGLPTDNYPALPDMNAKNTITLSQPKLKEMLGKTIYAAADDDARVVLNGAFVKSSDGVLNVVGLDGFRMGYRRSVIDGISDISVIVPKNAVNVIIKVLSDDAEKTVTVRSDGKQLFMDLDGTLVFSSLIEGKYFEYERTIAPDSQIVTKVKVRREDMLRAIGVGALFEEMSKNSRVKVSIEDTRMMIEGDSDMGNTYDEIPVDKIGEDMSISFNARYLTETLRQIEDEEIIIKLVSGVKPCVFCPVEGSDYIYIVMPVREK